MANRKAVHGYVTDQAHEWWHNTAHTERVSVSAIIQAIADHDYRLPGYIFTAAGDIDQKRRHSRWAKQ